MSRQKISWIAFVSLVIFSITLLLGQIATPWTFNLITLILSFLGCITFVIIYVGVATKHDGDPVGDIDSGVYDIVFMNVTAADVAVVLKNKQISSLL